MEKTGVDGIDRGEALSGAPRHDLPLCPNRMIIAAEAVRGPGFALELLREQLRLRASAKLVFSEYADCYFLQLDDVDRYQNSRVGMLDAMSTMPFRSSEIFRQEISTWTPADIDRVKDAVGLRALTELGLFSPSTGKSTQSTQ